MPHARGPVPPASRIRARPGGTGPRAWSPRWTPMDLPRESGQAYMGHITNHTIVTKISGGNNRPTISTVDGGGWIRSNCSRPRMTKMTSRGCVYTFHRSPLWAPHARGPVPPGLARLRRARPEARVHEGGAHSGLASGSRRLPSFDRPRRRRFVPTERRRPSGTWPAPLRNVSARRPTRIWRQRPPRLWRQMTGFWRETRRCPRPSAAPWREFDRTPSTTG